MFHDWIRAERQARGWSQSALAARLGVKANTVNQWEHDKRTPDAATLIRLAAVLGLPVPEVFIAAGLGDVPGLASVPLDALSALGVSPEIMAEFLRYAEYLGPEDWQRLLQTAQERAREHRAAQQRQQPQRHPSFRQRADVGADEGPSHPAAPRRQFTASEA